MSTLQTHLYSKLPFGDRKSFVRRYKKDSLVMFFWGQPRGGLTAVRKGSWGKLSRSSVTEKTVKLDGSLWTTSFCRFKPQHCARIHNIFAQKVYFINHFINFSWLSSWDAFKTSFLASSKVSGLLDTLQTKPAVSAIFIHLSRQRRLLRIHIQLAN